MWDDLKRQWEAGSMLTRLIFANVGVFTVIMTLRLLGRGFTQRGGGGVGCGGGDGLHEKLYAKSRPVPPHFSVGAA